MLAHLLALSDALSAASTEDADGRTNDPIMVMTHSMAALTALGESISAALAGLRSDARGVSSALTETAKGIDIHLRVGTVAEEGVDRLIQIADGLASEADLDNDTHQDIHRLMQPRYTMDRERDIHQIFAKNEPAPGWVWASTDLNECLDDLFL